MHFFRTVLWCTLVCGTAFGAAKDSAVVSLAREALDQASGHILASENISAADRITLGKASKQVRASTGTAFTEQELITAMDTIVDGFSDKLTPELSAAIKAAQEALIKRLRNFKVSGFAWAVDPNGAFFVDTQDPAFDMVFKNAAGEIKTRRIQADIRSIGIKIELAINLNFIFFIGDDLNFLDADEKIELGVGGEFSPSSIARSVYASHAIRQFGQREIGMQELRTRNIVLNVTAPLGLSILYAPFKKYKGGMLMLTLGFGLTSGLASVVTGGSLTPVA